MALRLVDVEVNRHGFRLGPIGLDFPEGAWVSVVGESGSGKSTLLAAISGVTPSGGRIQIDGVDVGHLPIEHRPCTACQQDPLLFPVYTVAENLAFPLHAQGLGWREALRAAVERAPEFQVPPRILEARGDRISGGEARRVALGRAFLRPFRVALLDEVTNGLDEETQRSVLRMLSEVHSRTKAVFIFVSHDPVLALAMSSRPIATGLPGFVLVMQNGRVAQIGTPREIYESPKTLYVARLFGQVSLLQGTVTGRVLSTEGVTLHVDSECPRVAVRSEHTRFVRESASLPNSVPALVTAVSYAGAQVRFEVRTPVGDLVAHGDNSSAVQVGDAGSVVFDRLLHFEEA